MKRLSRRAFHRLLASSPALGFAGRLAEASTLTPDTILPPTIAGYLLTDRDRAEAEEFLRRYRLSAAAVDAVPLADDIAPASPAAPPWTAPHRRSGT